MLQIIVKNDNHLWMVSNASFITFWKDNKIINNKHSYITYLLKNVFMICEGLINAIPINL